MPVRRRPFRENTVTVLELERLGGSLELRDRPELGPPEEYVEEFD
ncbi:hypothetical protein ACQEVY_03025 [Streptomyces sp. CA-288835]